MKRILVPTDFSDQAKYALDVALSIARKTGAAIKLLHVVEMPYRTPAFSAMGDIATTDNTEHLYTMQLLQATKNRMAELMQSLAAEGVEVVQEVDVDSITIKIKNVIAEDGVDLVVMGSKGSSGMEEFLIGSNTEKVVRTAACPVLTIKSQRANFEIKNIVLASDYKREIRSAMERFKEFQELFGATLHLVYINTPGAFEASKQVQHRMQEVAERYGLQNYTVNVYNDAVEEDGILHFASDIKADLIMMATHGRTGFSHLLSGSIAEDLVNHSAIPVLTFHLK